MYVGVTRAREMLHMFAKHTQLPSMCLQDSIQKQYIKVEGDLPTGKEYKYGNYAKRPSIASDVRSWDRQDDNTKDINETIGLYIQMGI